ncbi:hypothetical protein F4778DRAFT_769313 [Xylariomycetidae sp. FL2044]|nr:hypothetical protein F4778DRAFT_769313 [Xylariomycetidae sp. FL2044]
MPNIRTLYLGCNTCRNRRVKCDGTRPFCKKCTDYGRECGGYERETVFIVGTPDDKGRCASHPPRSASESRRREGIFSPQQPETLEFVACGPHLPAWDDAVLLSSAAGTQWFRFVAQHTNLESALPRSRTLSRESELSLTLPVSGLLDPEPTFNQQDFELKSHCLLSSPTIGGNLPSTSSHPEGLCLFLYEQNSSASYSNESPWIGPVLLVNAIQEAGPVAYQNFPAHHFFARVYRPSAIWAALLNRLPTFLCSPEWTVVPWEIFPRTPLDDLLDIVVLLPSIYSQADRTMPMESSTARSLKASALLSDCVDIERQFDFWYSMLQQPVNQASPLMFWISDARRTISQEPFIELYDFASPLLCLVHVYYWSILIGFHQCIYELVQTILESQGESSSSTNISPGIPPGIEPQRYDPFETNVFAANVCRSLDFGLRTTNQPDLLAAPLWAVNSFYHSLGAFGNSELELLWCAGFRERLNARTYEMQGFFQERRWIEIGRFGC